MPWRLSYAAMHCSSLATHRSWRCAHSCEIEVTGELEGGMAGTGVIVSVRLMLLLRLGRHWQEVLRVR